MKSGNISAVMVTHNGENYVAQQLKSMINQSLPLQKIVIVDDDSTDSTVAICREIASETLLPIIEIVSAPLRDPKSSLYTRIAQNFVFGISHLCDADIVFFADQDDIWFSNRTERQVLRQASTGAGLVVGDAVTIDEIGRTTCGSLRGQILGGAGKPATASTEFRQILTTPSVTGATMAVTADFLTIALPIPPGWLHDRWFSLVGAATSMLDISNDAVIKYRLHDSQVVGTGKFSESTATKLRKAWSLLAVIPRRLRKAKRTTDGSSACSVREYMAQLLTTPGIFKKAGLRK